MCYERIPHWFHAFVCGGYSHDYRRTLQRIKTRENKKA